MAEHARLASPQITGLHYVRPLGTGGFADVFLYEQDMPRRQVAVKVLKQSVLEVRDRSVFETEADTMARLSSHPSIVSVYAAGVSADGRPYLSMEWCPESMRERTRGKPAELQVVLDAGVRLAGALESAHQVGVLHRDIKPSNVLITTTGRPALTDFGISLLRGGYASQDTLHALSLPWSAPEVIYGHTSGTVASEVWALGATLYTFAAGVSPFESADPAQNTREKMGARIKRTPLAAIAGARGYEPFDKLLGIAMSKQPERRFVSMRAFGEALQQLQRHYGFDVTPLDVVEPGWVSPQAHVGVGRGNAITTVRPNTRAQRRAAHLAAQGHTEAIVTERPNTSALKAGLIGAAIAVGVVGVLIALAIGFSWFG